jgi:outer membrane lipoprotein-sorting protein
MDQWIIFLDFFTFMDNIEKHLPRVGFNLRTIVIVTFLSFLLFPDTTSQNYQGKVSIEALHQVYQKGNLFNAKSAILYDGESSEIIFHYFQPEEFYKKINSLGEITIYNPGKNTVTFTQNSQYSSSNELIYYFVNNQIQDMGLRNEGFTPINTERDGKYLVTTWQAPPGMRAISTVELVFENFLPVFAEYIDNNGRSLKKIYYYDYIHLKNFSFPQKITEIAYTARQDSTVKRTTFSDIRSGKDIQMNIFNFKIPSDAEKIDF